MLICKSGSKFTSGRDMLVDRRVAGSVDLRQQIDDDGGPSFNHLGGTVPHIVGHGLGLAEQAAGFAFDGRSAVAARCS